MKHTMDPYLASVYNTNDTIEKIASQVLVQKLAEAQGISADFSQLSPEQIEQIAQEQLDIASGEGGAGAQDPSQNIVKEAQQNLELADYMGRVMAHAFHQESGMIEKQAGMFQNAGKAIRGAGETAALHGMYAMDKVRPHAQKAIGAAKSVGGAISRTAQRGGQLLAGGERQSANASRPGNSLSKMRGPGKSTGDARSLEGHKMIATEGRKSLGARAALGAGAVGAGAAAHSMSKEASAFEQLARQQAVQMLEQQGIDTQPLLAHFEQQDQEAAMMEEQQMMQQDPQQQFQQPQMGQQGMNQRRQPQMGQQFQQQMQQPQQEQGMQQQQQDPQSAIKMANDMAMQQFQQMLDQQVMQTLADAGYEVGEEDPQAQMGGQPQQAM